MALDSYVTLGRSGLRVSPFCLGAMTFGDEGGLGSGVAESERILRTYLDRGGNFVDTANFYTNGHSEKILGDFLARQPGLRDRLVLATKFFGNLRLGDPNGGGAARKAIIHQLDQSLRRLRTHYIGRPRRPRPPPRLSQRRQLRRPHRTPQRHRCQLPYAHGSP
jgi:aryl-alcohol dehydrogenase-like predicted oxidoreductase